MSDFTSQAQYFEGMFRAPKIDRHPELTAIAKAMVERARAAYRQSLIDLLGAWVSELEPVVIHNSDGDPMRLKPAPLEPDRFCPEEYDWYAEKHYEYYYGGGEAE